MSKAENEILSDAQRLEFLARKLRKVKLGGWKKDVHDERDLPYKMMVRRAVPVPRLVDLRPKMSVVENQLSTGSCTANSAVSCIEYLDNREDGKYIDKSRLYVYYNTRDLEGTTHEDAGATLRDTIKSLVKWGACPEQGWRGWPYDEAKALVKPSFWCYWWARRRGMIKEYRKIIENDVQDMKECLAQGYPFIFGFMVTDAFMNDHNLALTGAMKMPQGTEKIVGGHAVCAAGYDDNRQAFIIRNSWGTEWGDDGYFYMPYAFIKDANWADDFWAIVR